MRQVVTAASAFVGRAVERVWTLWREFWFKPADPLPLAVMRILFGGMLFYTHLVWGMNLEAFFGPNGWQGEKLVHTFQQGQFAWSFWWLVPGGLRLTVHLLCLLVLALYTLGVLTPVTSILAYLITVSYAYRAPLANYGLDQINAIAALYLAIGPSGAALSLDRLWQLKQEARDSAGGGKPSTRLPILPSARANLALRLMQVHLCVIYIFACQSKLQGESWWNGQAIWQAVSNLEYQSTDLTWLAWYPWLVNILTHGTVLWEMTFWALVWRPLCRPIVLLIGVAIHLGIGAFMGMWTFGLSMIFLYVAFVPATTIHAVLRTVSGLFMRRSRPLEQPAETAAPTWEPPAEEPTAAAPALAVVPDDATRAPVAAKSTSGRVARPAKLPASPPRAPRINADPLHLGRRPAVVVVESRLKRQTQIQEYMVKRGFRCFVASDLHQARSLLCVADIDGMIVTSTWYTDEDVLAFREALMTGGPSLPASLFFVSEDQHPVASRGSDSPRHRLVRSPLSLHELRLLIREVLGQTESQPNEPQPIEPPRPSPPPNGNGHGKKPGGQSNPVERPTVPERADLESSPTANGAQT
jgi:hypothetical protein